MEGILGVLFILALIAAPFVIVIGGGSALTYIFTGKTPTQYAYEKEVNRRKDAMRLGRIDARMNGDAMRRLLDEDD
ncbi:hypothetical protein [Mycolicibacterium wolinskyi]|uniref:hypothetical protein n=1 Tax=Mycolicibacterium wolinskyi TaxID=59750 RepID=UPI00391771F5